MENFTVVCKKCQNEMQTLNMAKAFTDDPSEFIGDNCYHLICTRCYNREKVLITGELKPVVGKLTYY